MPHYNVYRRSVSGLLFRRIFHKIHPSRKSEISTVTLTERRAFKSGQKLSLAELLVLWRALNRAYDILWDTESIRKIDPALTTVQSALCRAGYRAELLYKLVASEANGY